MGLSERPVSEEDATAEENVRRTRGEAMDSVDVGLVESLATELVDELVVVYFASVFGRYLPWIHYLLLLLFGRLFLLHCCLPCLSFSAQPPTSSST